MPLKTPAQLGRNGTIVTDGRRPSSVISRQQQDPAGKRFSEDLLEGVTRPGIPGSIRISVTFSAPATDTPVRHGIPSKSVNYLVAGTDTSGLTVYLGSDPSGDYPTGTLWLRSNAAGTATILIFR